MMRNLGIAASSILLPKEEHTREDINMGKKNASTSVILFPELELALELHDMNCRHRKLFFHKYTIERSFPPSMLPMPVPPLFSCPRKG